MHNHVDIRNQTNIRIDNVQDAIYSLQRKNVITKKSGVKGKYEVLIADYKLRKVVRTQRQTNKKQIINSITRVNQKKQIINSITRLIENIPEEMRERVRKLHELPRSRIVKETGLNKVQVCLILDKLRTDGKLPRRVEDDDDITLFDRD